MANGWEPMNHQRIVAGYDPISHTRRVFDYKKVGGGVESGDVRRRREVGARR
jgi:hypothetical protein